MQAAHLAELTIVMEDVEKAAKQTVDNLKKIKAKAERMSEDDYIRAMQEQSRQVHSENRTLKEEIHQLKRAATEATLKRATEKAEYNALMHKYQALGDEQKKLKERLLADKAAYRKQSDLLATATEIAAIRNEAISKLKSENKWLRDDIDVLESRLEESKNSKKLERKADNLAKALESGLPARAAEAVSRGKRSKDDSEEPSVKRVKRSVPKKYGPVRVVIQ